MKESHRFHEQQRASRVDLEYQARYPTRLPMRSPCSTLAYSMLVAASTEVVEHRRNFVRPQILGGESRVVVFPIVETKFGPHLTRQDSLSASHTSKRIMELDPV